MAKRQIRPKVKRRNSTPTRLIGASRTDGLVVRVGVDGTPPEKALKLAARVVSAKLPGDWTIQRLGPDSRDFAIRRPKGGANPSVATAFEYSYRLREHRDVEDCEPALVLPVEGPAEMRSQARTARSRSSSGSGDEHLSCTEARLWAHKLCRAQQAWQLPLPTGGNAQGEGVVVGHPDTGYTLHPELADLNRLLIDRGFDFEDGDADARDSLTGFSPGHGTGTGSVIISSAATEVGVAGIAPRASLVPLRVTSSVVLLSFAKLAEAIRFAADSNHHVISISLGGPAPSRFLHRAVQHAVDRGVILLCAAGNVWPFVVYPARLDEVIAVAACNCQRRTWSDSAAGSDVDITAPGESVWRARTAGSTFSVERGSGTSFATAIVAGAAALWLAYHGRNKLIDRFGLKHVPSVFKELLLTHGFDRPSGWDTTNFGAGILNIAKLLSAPLLPTPPAGGMRALHASMVPRSKNQLDEILDLFPEEKPEKIHAALARLLKVSDRDLPAAIRDVGDELAYLAATDMHFRRIVLSPQPRAAALSAGRQTAISSKPVSRRLRRRINT